jgi:exodeoxyribonuclease V alpha subunit
MTDFVAGYIRNIVHNTDDFYILAFEVSESSRVLFTKMIKVKGTIVGLTQLKVDVPIRLTGAWNDDPKWGKQFVIHGWTPWSPDNAGIVKFLHECVPGFIDRALPEAIVKKFGHKTFEVMAEDPDAVFELFDRVLNLPGAPPEEAIQTALDQWNLVKATYELATFLGDHDIGSQHIKAVIEAFGYESLKVVSHNPYRLLSVYGWTFPKVDGVAERLDIPKNDPRRYEGAVFWCLRDAAGEGHLFVRRGDMANMVHDLVHNSGVSPFGGDLSTGLAEAVDRLIKEGIVKIDPMAGVYLLNHWKHERECAERISEFVGPTKLDVDVKEFLENYERTQAITLSDAQRKAVETFVENRVLVLTGLPGTGKTTVIRTIVALLKMANITFTLMAPTGIAAKRLSAVTENPASTIHRLFRYDGRNWGYNRYNKYPIGATVVDEMSMVDQELFYRIVDALTTDTMVLLVGDDAQLPSVGPGNVLRELVRSQGIPHVRLTEIFRQKKTSDIVLNSHKINRGEFLTFEGTSPDSEFRFIPLPDEDKAVELIVQMALKLKGKDANFQVLSPKYDGAVGVNNLNSRLREALNPSKGQREAKFGQLHVREGDRLMIIRNNYRLGVYNGDMGKLMTISDRELGVRVHGAGEGGLDELIHINRGESSSMLRLAYAITVHKSQGSEFDTVIIPVYRTQGRMLLRNLLYTAVTRAKKKVWLIGDLSAVHRAIGNDNIVQRNTAFGRSVSEAIAKRLAGVGSSRGGEDQEPVGGPAP